MADEKIDEIRAHVASCPVCIAAHNRANDFCPTGLLLFSEWAQSHSPTRVELVEITKEQHDRLVEEQHRRRRNAERN